MQISDLNQYPFRKFRDLFVSLNVPESASVLGIYRAAFVGPRWLRASAGPVLGISGLGGWWGKEFHDDGTAINIVLRAGKFSTLFPMKFVKTKSFIDGREGLALHYQPGNPYPWPIVVDEIRRIDETSLLGMTIANVRGLRGLAFPFVLQKES